MRGGGGDFSEPLGQIGVIVNGVEFFVEPTEEQEGLFGDFILEGGVEVFTIKDTAASGPIGSHSTGVILLKGASAVNHRH